MGLWPLSRPFPSVAGRLLIKNSAGIEYGSWTTSGSSRQSSMKNL